jgi:hypothetical protein
MHEPRDDAKSSETESAATDLPLGTVFATASLSISSPARTEVLTTKLIASGDAEVRMAVIPAAITPARSSPLSANEEKWLGRIRKDRANRFMVSAVDVDFLIQIVERLSR